MADELAVLEANKTWTIMPLPPNKKAIACRWIYKTKFNPDATIERHKVRLVVKEFTQQLGIDFTHNLSPILPNSPQFGSYWPLQLNDIGIFCNLTLKRISQWFLRD